MKIFLTFFVLLYFSFLVYAGMVLGVSISELFLEIGDNLEGLL